MGMTSNLRIQASNGDGFVWLACCRQSPVESTENGIKSNCR
ncbi:protein of unknown function [Xenorhabdus poinarii G6]|uniref:Uncharacterized protein n=1 Tax=Xenorhabdus poinarii G6 TaxID=1354304 RepID=A0A068R341_9GAMM|nr:protein of unknown function [Xenorhabdus poinarii G6]